MKNRHFIGDIKERGIAINASSSLMKNTTIQSKRVVIGGLEIIGLNFEPSHDWIELLGMSHDDNCLAVTGYVGHVLGYLPTPKQILEGGYEVDGFKKYFEFHGDWGTCRLDLRKSIQRLILNKENKQ